MKRELTSSKATAEMCFLEESLGTWGTGNGPEIKGTYPSCRGSGCDSQHPHGSSQLSYALLWPPQATALTCTYSSYIDTLIHVIRKKINLSFLLRRQSLNVQLGLVMNS